MVASVHCTATIEIRLNKVVGFLKTQMYTYIHVIAGLYTQCCI